MGALGVVARPLLSLYRPIDRFLVSLADAVLVNGEFGQQLVRDTYNRSSTIITHGADLAAAPSENDVRLFRRRMGIGRRPAILTVNHLHPRKRVSMLIDAMPAVLAQHPDAVLLIAGRGPDEPALRARAALHQLTGRHVVFCGFVGERDLPACYAAANVYAHSGLAESFGLSVLEASRSGLPVVAVDEGGPRQIIQDAQTGFLVPSNPEALAFRISWLLARPNLAVEMGRLGAARAADRYSWQRGAMDFANALGRAMSATMPHAPPLRTDR
jgi:phosphatidylinositol alpha-1,6-mannosyltransferase